MAQRADFGVGRVAAGLTALLLAVPCGPAGALETAASATIPALPAAMPANPVASDARIAGDDSQTRFILDLDRAIDIRAFALSEQRRVVVDLPQVSFRLAPGAGTAGRGLIKAFRYGMVMPGGSRIVFDLASPAKIDKAYVLEAANGQPARLIVDLAAEAPAAPPAQAAAAPPPTAAATPPPAPPATVAAVVADATGSTPAVSPMPDPRPVVVIDPGHGGVDNGTQAGGETEKDLVLNFALALRDRLEKAGKYRVVMTRTDDTFIPLGDRTRIARARNAALFLSIHADALPRGEGMAQGATVYTLSDKASDAEAERLADSENRADAIGGVNLTEEPTDVADILIELAQRETRSFSNVFARALVSELKSAARLHKNPLKSAGFKVLKAPDVPSVLLELGYVSNKSDLQQLLSEQWRSRTVGAVSQAIDAFFAKRLVSATKAN